MSRLSRIKKNLGKNKKIVIVGIEESNMLSLLPTTLNNLSHTVSIYVAPAKKMRNAKKMQKLMMLLLPSMKPTRMDEFRENKTTLYFGKLYFDEKIGTAKIHYEYMLSDPDLHTSEGFENGKLVINQTEKLRRRTWVMLFPSKEIAEQALRKKISQYNIEKNDL